MRLGYRVRFLYAAALCASLAACGGGGGSVVAPQPSATPQPIAPSVTGTSVVFSITFPATQSGTASRTRHYVSPSIASLALTINGGPPIYVNAPAPPRTAPQTVTTTVPAPPGTDTFSAAEFDQPNGAGDVLGRVTETYPVIIDMQNVVPITVNGELASIAIQPVASPFLAGTRATGFTLVGNQPQTFAAVPQDFKGNMIVAPGLVPAIAVTSAEPAAVIVARSQTINTFTLQAPAPTAPVTISATGTNLEGAAVTTSFDARALGAFYIADFTAQRIRVFDENGTPLVLPQTSFAFVANPMGLAYVPGIPGSIVVTQTANFVAPFIVSFDPAGNPQPSAAGAFAGATTPLFLSYGAGKLFVPNYSKSTLSIFDTSGAGIPLISGSYPKLAQPVAATYDAHNGELYVTNDATDTISAYSPSGALVATAATGSHPMGIAFDPTQNSLYVTYGGTLGDGLDPPPEAAQLAGISEFSEALTAVSTTGGFANASAMTFFTGIAFDPFAKLVYASDAGMSRIDAFTQTGAAVTLAPGAFSTVSGAAVPPGDPMAILFIP